MARPTDDLDWGGTAVEPSSGQKSTGYIAGDRPAAQHWNWILQTIDAWLAYFDTEGLPFITQADASLPVFGVRRDSQDHPSSASNKWKLVTYMAVADGNVARMYSGDGTAGVIAITLNASWNPASGSQTWVKDNNSDESSILRFEYGQLRWYGKAPGAGSWADSGWDNTRGGITAGASITAPDLTIADDLAVGDDATVGGDLAVTGIITVTNDLAVGDDATVGGDLAVTGAITGASITSTVGNVVAASSFAYAAPVIRAMAINIWDGHGDGAFSSVDQMLIANGDLHIWPLKLKAGPLRSVRIKLDCTSTDANYTVTWIIHDQPDFSTGTSPGHTDHVSASGTCSGTPVNITLGIGGTGGSGSIKDEAEAFSLSILCTGGAGSLLVQGLQLEFSDSGPECTYS